MTLVLDGDDIRALASEAACEQAAWAAVRAESTGSSALPPRIDVPSGHGFLRVMPAVLGSVMGVKVMTLTEGVGNRYLVLLYDVRSGELCAVLDADELTRLRTAAFTAVAARLMVPRPPVRLALLGSGHEAEGHLRALTRMWGFESVSVFSPSRERRERFAARMTSELSVKIVASESCELALQHADLVMMATKTREPVLDGAHVAAGAVVLSVGSTRPNLRELDAATMRRTGTLVVDDAGQVFAESGDIIAGLQSGDLREDLVTSVSRVSADQAGLLRRTEERDLLTFKSVGTALQDLALAEILLRAAREQNRGRDVGELAALKPFADNGVKVST